MKKLRLRTVSMYADDRFREIREILENMVRLDYPGLGTKLFSQGHEIAKITLLKGELPSIRELIEQIGEDFGYLGYTALKSQDFTIEPWTACSQDGETSFDASTPEEALCGLWTQLREQEEKLK